MDNLHQELLETILSNPELKAGEICEKLGITDKEDRQRAYQMLFYLRTKSEEAVCDEARRYTITAKGRAWLKEAGVALPAAGKKPRGRGEPEIPQPSPGRRDGKAKPPHHDVRAAAQVIGVSAEELQHSLDKTKYNGSAATRGIADKLLQQAQDALDEYVASVCDPEILGRFQARATRPARW